MPTRKSKTIGIRVGVVPLANLALYYKKNNVVITSQGALLRRALEDLSKALTTSEPSQRWFNDSEELNARKYLTSLGLSDQVGFNPTIIGQLSSIQRGQAVKLALSQPSKLADELKEGLENEEEQ